MERPILSETIVRSHASAESFQRGRDYYKERRVVSLIQRGNQIRAEVEGNQYAAYHVTVGFDGGGITSAACTCPYDWGGWCKHVVATLLACLHEPDAIQVLPPMEEMLAALDREQLLTLVRRLANSNPEVAAAVETQVSLLQIQPGEASKAQPAPPPQAAPRPRRTQIDTSAIRRQVKSLMRSSSRYDYYNDYEGVDRVLQPLEQIVQQAEASIEAGDGNNALAILQALTEEFLPDFEVLDDSYGQVGDFFRTVGDTLAGAVLTAELSADEKQDWSKTFLSWHKHLEDYGMDDCLPRAMLALQQGWDNPKVQQWLQGTPTDAAGTDDDDEDDMLEDELELVAIRLNILQHQSRHQEYLNMARATGHMKKYVTMLVQQGNPHEAVNEARTHLHRAEDALSLATILRERDELTLALQIAEHGLELNGPRERLARWTSELALTMGHNELALRAASIAFRAMPSLTLYQQIQKLAGEEWPALRDELLQFLRGPTDVWDKSGHIDVFLAENLIDDAIAIVDDTRSRGYSSVPVGRVMLAAVEQRPSWVINIGRNFAEQIINAGQAKYYDDAVKWLEIVRTAYFAANMKQEWHAYVGQIRRDHGRKYKLMGLMQQFF